MTMKRCSKCRKLKPMTGFHRDSNRPDGLYCYCKECTKSAKVASYTANKREVLAQKAVYYAANREKVAIQKAVYYVANRGKVLERIAAYQAAHPEKVREWKAAYRAAHLEKVRALTAVFRARKAGAPVIERYSRVDIFHRDGWLCQICGRFTNRRVHIPRGEPYDPMRPTVDHIVPLSKGGDHLMANAQTAHARCNLEKG